MSSNTSQQLDPAHFKKQITEVKMTSSQNDDKLGIVETNTDTNHDQTEETIQASVP